MRERASQSRRSAAISLTNLVSSCWLITMCAPYTLRGVQAAEREIYKLLFNPTLILVFSMSKMRLTSKKSCPLLKELDLIRKLSTCWMSRDQATLSHAHSLTHVHTYVVRSRITFYQLTSNLLSLETTHQHSIEFLEILTLLTTQRCA